METGRDEIAVVLMEPLPVRRQKTQYRSLRRQVYFFQSISVLFCFTCCLFTVMYHSSPTTCKDNGTVKESKIEMQHQDPNSSIHEEMHAQRMTSLIRLTAKSGNFPEKGHVPWTLNEDENPNGYFTLDKDSESLTILRDGTYKVSLQITYRGLKERNGIVILQHDINRHTASYPGVPLTLLTYMETVNFTSPYWMKSLFSEGIFYLEHGDRLMVWADSLPLIDVGDKKTVFVVYPHFST